jgi:hypothetical protein
MNQLPPGDATLAHARVYAINRAKPNPNLCLGCTIRALEKVIHGLNPIWCKFVHEDQVRFFTDSNRPYRQCINCFLLEDNCYQVGLL